MQIEVERAYEELKEMYGEENIISADPRRRDNALICQDFVPLTAGGIYRRYVIGDKKKCAGRKRNFLKQCNSSLAHGIVWSRESTI